MAHLMVAIIYISFISLGLPDALLGAAWPTMYGELGATVSQVGLIYIIISAGTVVSSLMSDRLTYRLGTGKVTAISVGMTAVALFGFSFSTAYWQLCLWAVPYGLGAGSVDASLNNYVALHYSSKHMSWLHCMWGVGASVGPYIMGFLLFGGRHWSLGYRYIGVIQIVLTAGLFFSLPLWKTRAAGEGDAVSKPLPLKAIVKVPGVKEILVCFFCYSALEQTAALWASSYLVLHKGVDTKTAAFFASIFFIGITVGRAFNGFLTEKFNDTQLIRMGMFIIGDGLLVMLLPLGTVLSLAGLIFIGLGCAPIYPCIIHSTPYNFGADKSQAIIGVQMAGAYVANIIMPPLFGLIADYISISLFPVYMAAILVLMIFMHGRMLAKCKPSCKI